MYCKSQMSDDTMSPQLKFVSGENLIERPNQIEGLPARVKKPALLATNAFNYPQYIVIQPRFHDIGPTALFVCVFFFGGGWRGTKTLIRYFFRLFIRLKRRTSRYSGFLWVVPTNAWIFLRGLKLWGEREIGGYHAFFRDNKVSIWKKKKAIHCFVFYCFLNNCRLIISKKMHGYPQFSFWISIALFKVCLTRIVISRAKILWY